MKIDKNTALLSVYCSLLLLVVREKECVGSVYRFDRVSSLSGYYNILVLVWCIFCCNAALCGAFVECFENRDSISVLGFQSTAFHHPFNKIRTMLMINYKCNTRSAQHTHHSHSKHIHFARIHASTHLAIAQTPIDTFGSNLIPKNDWHSQ